MEVTPRRPESHEETPFKTVATRAADHLLSTVDGKAKSFAGELSTYADVRNIVRNIQKSGYFDKAAQPPPVVEEIVPETVAELSEPSEEVAEAAQQEEVPADEQPAVAEEPDFQVAPAAAAVPAPSFPPQQSSLPPQHHQSVPLLASHQPQQLLHQQQAQQQLNGPPTQLVQSIIVPPMLPVVNVPASNNPQQQQQQQSQQLHLAPTTVRAVEQAYFKQHQYITQMRPLSEVINAQNFYFLQESELDQPDVLQQQHPQQQAGVTAFAPSPSQISPNVQQPIQNLSNQQHIQQAHLLDHHQQQQHLSASVRSAPQPPQLQSQAFNNQQPFANVLPVGAPLFPANLKPGDLPQSHIPGFANANAPIQLLNQQQQPAQQLQQQQHNHLQHQQQQQQNNALNNINAPIPTFHQQQQQTGSAFLPLQAIVSAQQSSTSLSSVKLNQANQQQQQLPLDVDNRAPEINEWKPEDAVKADDQLSNEWQGQFFQAAPVEPEVSDWNDESPAVATEAVAGDETNDWSPTNNGGQQPRFPYRNNQSGGYNGGGRGHNNNRNGGGGARNVASTTNADGSAATTAGTNNNNLNGGYRNRSNYNQSNGGGGGAPGSRSQPPQTQSSGGGASTGTTSSGTFYRNNESYYQNGGNSGGGYRGNDNKGAGGYRDNKPDGGGGYRGGNNHNFRSRDTSGNSAAVRNTAGGLTNRPNNNNSRYNSDSIERGQGSRPNTNNGPSPVGGGSVQQHTSSANRGLATATKHSSGVYGGGPRPSGAARQTVNV